MSKGCSFLRRRAYQPDESGLLREAQVYPVAGLGDAWMQNQPSSIGITNGYDARFAGH
jgi:hypothetical protein